MIVAAKIRLEFHADAFPAIRTDPAVREDLRRRAEAVAEAAGEGVEVLPEEEPRERAHLVVAPVTTEAAIRIAKDNDLIRALEAGRG